MKHPPPLVARAFTLALTALGFSAACDGTKEVELTTRTVRVVRNNDGGSPIQLVGSGISTCSHGLNGDRPSGNRWCAFARAAAGGKTELWVVNLSRALIDERAAVCDGSSPHCLLLTSDLWDESPLFEIGHPFIHGFTGDTLIFYADSRSANPDAGYLGPVRGWRPGMTASRQITGPSGFSCIGHLRSDGVICLENESGSGSGVQFDLVAGRLSGGSASEPLPKVRRISPYGGRRAPSWQVGFSPSGAELLLSTVAPDGPAERLEVIPSGQVGQMEPRELLRDLSRWEVSPDGRKIFYVAGLVGPPDGDGMGTLTVADFPSMTNPVQLAPRVAGYELYGPPGARDTGPVRSVSLLQEASIDGGTLRMIPDLERPTEVVTVASNISDPRVSPDLRYSIVENARDGVTYLAHNGGAGQCALADEGVNAFGVAFANSGRRVFWMQSAPAMEGISAAIEAWTADPEGCHGRRKIIDKLAFLRPTRRGLLYGQEEETPTTMAVFFDRLTIPASPPTLLARTVDPQFSVVDDQLFVFTISGENRDAGLWVHGPVP